jgi:DNA topoisomerase IA
MGLRDKPTHRIEFHEVTRDAVLHAVAHPRSIDQRRVDAQQARLAEQVRAAYMTGRVAGLAAVTATSALSLGLRVAFLRRPPAA